MLAAIVAVGERQQFTITSVSGGPHATTSKHFSGNAIDIVPVNQALMDAFVRAGAVPPNGNPNTSMCEKKIKDAAGKIIGVRSVDCTNGGGDHIHLIFF